MRIDSARLQAYIPWQTVQYCCILPARLRVDHSAPTIRRQLGEAVRGCRNVLAFIGITAAKLAFVFCTGQTVLQLKEVAMFGLLDYVAYRLVQLNGSAPRPPFFGGFGV